MLPNLQACKDGQTDGQTDNLIWVELGNLSIGSHSEYLPLVFWLLSVSLKRTKNKISNFGLYTTKTVYYEVSCCIVVGWGLKATVDRGSDLAGALCELPPKTALPHLIFAPTLGYIGCPDVKVRHRLPQWLGLRAGGGVAGVKIIIS